MSEANLLKNYFQLISAIELCIEQKLVMPALVLIYTGIDSVSWLSAAEPTRSVGDRFQSWVLEWMYAVRPLSCTPEELYAARCGLLHTLTPNSTLTERKNVRRIAYAWGKGEQKDLNDSIATLKYEGLVGIHINDLFESFRFGFSAFLEKTMNDDIASKTFTEKAKKHFSNIDKTKIDFFLSEL
jgi:hypothetical protein